jgi:transposase
MARKRGQPYSQDLRDRVLTAVDGGMGVYEAAPLFRVSVSYIYKAVGRRRRTGETAARPQRSHRQQKLAPHHEAIGRHVEAHPDATIEELRAWLLATHGVSASSGGMWNALHRLKLTLKKSHSMPPSRNAPTSPRRARPGGPNRTS